jgi:hypothetical protein
MSSSSDETYFNSLKKEDMLTYGQIKVLLNPDAFPNEKAKVIGDCLLKYCVHASERLYMIDKHLIYSEIKGKKIIERKIKNMVSKIIELSFKSCSEGEKDYIKQCKSFASVKSEKGVDIYYNALIEYISNDALRFDYDTKYELHFLNGYIDLKTNTFHKRQVGKHYITMCIQRNYKKASKKSIDFIYSLINKIWTLKEDRDYNLSQLGRAISGDSGKEQTNLFWLGCGSSGKSLIMKLCIEALGENYVLELGSNTFEKGNPDINKILNQFDIVPIIRIAWINELSGKTMNDELFKEFCEGVLKTSKLYKEGIHKVLHDAKLICTSNEMPNIKQDSGVQRRTVAYYFKSQFVEKMEDVNEAKNIFLCDANLIADVKANDELLNAFVDILVKHCIDWHHKKAPAQPASFSEAKNTLITANDKFQDFVDKYLVITNDQKDRIGKDEMRTLFLEMYPEKHLTVQQVISSLKDKKIDYNPQYRVNNVKGVYVGVKIKGKSEKDKLHADLGETVIDLDEHDDGDNKFDIVAILQKQIADQHAYIKQLELLVQDINLPKKSVSTKKITTKEVVTVVEKPAPEFPRKIKKVKSSDFDFDGILTIG